MDESTSPTDVFLRLVHGVSDQRWDDLPGLYAESTNVRHPLSPTDRSPMTSRAELARHFGSAGARNAGPLRFQPSNIVIHETTDPEVIVAEFTYDAVSTVTGKLFSLPNVFVMRIRDGEIVESRDYVDHHGLAQLVRGDA